jgi:hypothetical protein
MDPIFSSVALNERGKAAVAKVRHDFDELLDKLRVSCEVSGSGSTREFAIVKTKLEEACFFAVKSVVYVPANHE